MFRKMRRFKQQLTPEECLRILKEGKYGVLSLIGDDGYPYGVPVNYVYYDSFIYIHSAKSGHKIDAIKNSDKISFTIVSKDDVIEEKLTSYFKSIIIFGKAEMISDEEEMKDAMLALGRKYSSSLSWTRIEEEIKNDFKALSVIKIEIKHMTGKQAIELVNK